MYVSTTAQGRINRDEHNKNLECCMVIASSWFARERILQRINSSQGAGCEDAGEFCDSQTLIVVPFWFNLA
ncbi:hypothetical protein Pr1d_53360 [Bythopirellula goksoeyrii]|uniref:Uncharacterized protein n=1 Tax=Bythopirellula goksoeyrii TaxID=1400387 RepID=A0A5B9QG39_9BACT|nr:hypothetical protein Pr1d_53360 [Bythopirellula goksoeyrii]